MPIKGRVTPPPYPVNGEVKCVIFKKAEKITKDNEKHKKLDV